MQLKFCCLSPCRNVQWSMMWKLREILEDSNSDVRIAKESKPKNDNKNETKKKILRDHGHNLLGFPLQAYFLCVYFHTSSQWSSPAFHLINIGSMKCPKNRKKNKEKLIEMQSVWDCTLHQEKAELLCKQTVKWPWPPGDPKLRTSFTFSEV